MNDCLWLSQSWGHWNLIGWALSVLRLGCSALSWQYMMLFDLEQLLKTELGMFSDMPTEETPLKTGLWTQFIGIEIGTTLVGLKTFWSTFRPWTTMQNLIALLWSADARSRTLFYDICSMMTWVPSLYGERNHRIQIQKFKHGWRISDAEDQNIAIACCITVWVYTQRTWAFSHNTLIWLSLAPAFKSPSLLRQSTSSYTVLQKTFTPSWLF